MRIVIAAMLLIGCAPQKSTYTARDATTDDVLASGCMSYEYKESGKVLLRDCTSPDGDVTLSHIVIYRVTVGIGFH